MRTKMLSEIKEQYEVSKNVICKYADKIKELNSEMLKKSSVWLVGTGASLNACNASKTAFAKYSGFLPQVIGAGEIPYYINCMDKDSLVIIVSQSGQSFETQKAIQTLNLKGIEVWGFTNAPESALGRGSSKVLTLEAGEEVSSATKTYMATVLILYMLAAAKDSHALKSIELIPDDIAETMKLLESRCDVLAQELCSSRDMYLAGIGAHGPVAAQGALLLKEKTFIHTEGLPISEFRHGTVEVISPELPVILSACSTEKTSEALEHAQYLMRNKANVYIISDQNIKSPIIPDNKIINIKNSVDEVLSHVTAGIVYQLLSEAIAFKNGYDVDGFRFLSKIVDKY